MSFNKLTMNSKTIRSNKNRKNKTRKNKKLMWDDFNNNCNIHKLEQNIENDMKDNNTKNFCKFCSNLLLITDDGFLTCVNNGCGIIYKDTLVETPEWRYYGANDNNNSDPTRCGMPINLLLKESSFASKVNCYNNSSYEMKKIRKYTEWLGMPYREKSNYDDFQKITILANQSGIPKLIIDDAIIYYKKISEAQSFRGLNRDGIIAASIYVSSRINNYPRTAKEIATIFHLDNTSSTKGCKNALSIINNLESQFNNKDKTLLHQTTPVSFIDRYCSKLNISNELTKLCKFIAIRIHRNNMIPENTPPSIAAGIIYFVSQICSTCLSKKSVSNISEISEVTINKCYKKLVSIRLELIPKKLLDKYNIE